MTAQPFDAVVDALYGTGFHGSLRPVGLAACALINRQRENGAFVLAVDLPSGVNTDTGEVAEDAVHADLTVTFDSYKPLHTAPAPRPSAARSSVPISASGMSGIQQTTHKSRAEHFPTPPCFYFLVSS